MPSYTITYVESKTPRVVEDSIQKAIQRCYSADTMRGGIWRLLHAIAYSAVFKVPEHLLEDGKKYSVEDICSYQKGLINNVGLNTFLNRIGAYQFEDAADESILEILADPLLPEIFQFLEQPVFNTYGALCAAYCLCIEDNQKYNSVLRVMNAPKGNKYQQCYQIITGPEV